MNSMIKTFSLYVIAIVAMAGCSGGNKTSDNAESELVANPTIAAAVNTETGSKDQSGANPTEIGSTEKTAKNESDQVLLFVDLAKSEKPLFMASAALATIDLSDLNQRMASHQRFAAMLNQNGKSEFTAEQLEATWGKVLGNLSSKDIGTSKENIGKFLAYLQETDRVLSFLVKAQNALLSFLAKEYLSYKNSETSVEALKKQFYAVAEMFEVIRNRFFIAANIYGVDVFPVSTFDYRIESKKNYQNYNKDASALSNPLKDKLDYYDELFDPVSGKTHKYPIKPPLVSFFERFITDSYSKIAIGYLEGGKETSYINFLSSDFSGAKNNALEVATLKISIGDLEQFRLFMKPTTNDPVEGDAEEQNPSP